MVVLAVGLAALGSAASAVAQEAAKVDYPTGYRDWTHVKSMVIQPGHQLYESFGGIHHIYANQSALEGCRTGSFADGSVIIFDLLEATTADNAITEVRCSA
jgi:Cytochrome P460